jgi:hypothetical protein
VTVTGQKIQMIGIVIFLSISNFIWFIHFTFVARFKVVVLEEFYHKHKL